MTKFDFAAQLSDAKEYEAVLDAYLERRGWELRQATREEEASQGIDRYATKDGQTITVEYKADTHDSGIFLELGVYNLVGAHGHKHGWAYRCQADWIIYWHTTKGYAYILEPNEIRSRIPVAVNNAALKVVDNGGYYGIGVVVDPDQLGAKKFNLTEE